jgi:hypothetical protein
MSGRKSLVASAPYPILDFRFWILDWQMPFQLTVSEIEIMQV